MFDIHISVIINNARARQCNAQHMIMGVVHRGINFGEINYHEMTRNRKICKIYLPQK